MTNFDVIESYAEDFTRLNYYEHRGTIDRTPNKIVITESKTDILNIIENINTSILMIQLLKLLALVKNLNYLFKILIVLDNILAKMAFINLPIMSISFLVLVLIK